MNKQQMLEKIAEKYVEVLENFNGGWDNPVIDFSAKNNFSDKCYNGFNALLLALVSTEKKCNKFATFQQWTNAKYKIKKGAKGFPVIFWQIKEKTESEQLKNNDIEGTENKSKYMFMKTYTVFNGSDIEGFEDKKVKQSEDFNATEIQKIENFYKNISEIKLTREMNRVATYAPDTDTVNIPPTEMYKDIVGLCSSFAHEYIHATGHDSRLKRNLKGNKEDYAVEELIAEIGAGLVSGKLGYSYQFNKNCLAYLKGWMKAIKSEKDKSKLILSVCSQAQKASDYLIGKKGE